MIDYALSDGVATITMDDGKANALSPTMLAAISDAFDRAAQDAAGAVVLAGRSGRFSAGFDLGVMQSGPAEATAMVRSGFELAEKVLSFRRPVVFACTGHAIAMGALLLLTPDHRVGADGEFRIQANEVAIGMTMPHAALALLNYRLTRPAFDRAVNLATAWTPRDAVGAGWLDEVAAPDEVVGRAQAVAAGVAALPEQAHVASKLRARAGVLGELRQAIDSGESL